MGRRYDDEGADDYDLRLEDAREQRAFMATMRCKGDSSECSCPNCNPAEDDFEKQDE